MSWKSIVITGLLCVVASPVLAAPTLTVDLLRDGSNKPVLTAGGDWQWVISVSPDAALFANNPPNGTGGSVALELNFQASAAALIGASKNATNFPNDNPGNEAATYPDVLGVGIAGNKGTANLGSTYFTTGGAKQAVIVVTDGPNSTVSLTTTLEWLGSYAGKARIAQAGVNTDTFSGSITKTVLGGDADFNGDTNFDDFLILQNNYNGSGKIWTTGDFNGSGTANFDDFLVLQNSYATAPIPAPGGGSLSGSAVPEPASALLALLGASVVGLIRRRK